MNIPDFTLGSALTEEQMAFFDAHGFIRFRAVANEAECVAFSRMRSSNCPTNGTRRTAKRHWESPSSGA